MTPTTTTESHRRQDIAGFAGSVLAGLTLLWFISFVPRKGSTDVVNEIPRVTFADVSASSGLDFVHRNGAAGEKLLPETMGGGVAFLDYDNDGSPDLLFTSGSYWPSDPRRSTAPAASALTLYRNDGTGHYRNVTPGSGLESTFYAMGVACGDFDNDGWVDVFVTGVGENHLFKNLGGGKFVEIRLPAVTTRQPGPWSTSAAWFDFDNDGLLDLFVCNYVEWSRDQDLRNGFTYDGKNRAYGPPRSFGGCHPLLYHNLGGGRFAEIAAQAGLQVTNHAGLPLAKSLGVAPVDLDGDGWIDIVVANDTVQNLVFRNERDGTFREIGARSGIGFDSFGSVRGAMGIDTARFRDDDSLAIAIGNFANEMNSLYVTQNDPLHFADEAATAGLGQASQQYLKFGLFFFDYDLDGRLDVLTANGHLDPDVERLSPPQLYRQPAQLYWNRGGGRNAQFALVPASRAGNALFQPIVGRGSAYADIDGDGDLDAILTQISGPPLLLRNDQHLGHHWLRLKLKGRHVNRDAIGAWVKVRVGGSIRAQQVMPTKGYLSQSELPLTFGLGDRVQADEVEIVWPGGKRQRVENPRRDALTVVEELP